MNLFDALLGAQMEIFRDTNVRSSEVHMHPEDVIELRRDNRFTPMTAENSLLCGFVFDMQIKANSGTKQGWANMYGHGLEMWKLVRLRPAPPPVTAWDKVSGEDLV